MNGGDYIISYIHFTFNMKNNMFSLKKIVFEMADDIIESWCLCKKLMTL